MTDAHDLKRLLAGANAGGCGWFYNPHFAVAEFGDHFKNGNQA